MTTVHEAQQWLRERVDDGARCPVCTQFAKVYRRKITSGAARALILMHRQHRGEWVHVPSTTDLARLGGEFARLRYWGLVEEEPERRDDGGRAGWWRITAEGERYVLGQLRVPKYARVYDGRCLRLDGEPQGIRDALSIKFDYAELMAA